MFLIICSLSESEAESIHKMKGSDLSHESGKMGTVPPQKHASHCSRDIIDFTYNSNLLVGKRYYKAFHVNFEIVSLTPVTGLT